MFNSPFGFPVRDDLDFFWHPPLWLHPSRYETRPDSDTLLSQMSLICRLGTTGVFKGQEKDSSTFLRVPSQHPSIKSVVGLQTNVTKLGLLEIPIERMTSVCKYKQVINPEICLVHQREDEQRIQITHKEKTEMDIIIGDFLWVLSIVFRTKGILLNVMIKINPPVRVIWDLWYW